MRKIPTLFVRNYDGDRLVRNEVTPEAAWVLAGEGIATAKMDGSCCLVKGGKLFKRHEVKNAAIVGGVMQRCPPPGFVLEELDRTTQKAFGWLPVGDGPEDRWHREALANYVEVYKEQPKDWTYELCGPKVQGNPEGFPVHMLIPHGYVEHGCPFYFAAPRTYEGLKALFADPESDVEGLVWWRDPANLDCDKVKVKAKDFGIKRHPRPAPDNKGVQET